MSPERCDGCGDPVRIGSAFVNVWDLDQRTTGGVILELGDGSEHFLCGRCLDLLPDDRDPTAEDVAALPES